MLIANSVLVRPWLSLVSVFGRRTAFTRHLMCYRVTSPFRAAKSSVMRRCPVWHSLGKKNAVT